MDGKNTDEDRYIRNGASRQKEAFVGRTITNHHYMMFFRPRKPPDFDCPGFFGSFSFSFFLDRF